MIKIAKQILFNTPVMLCYAVAVLLSAIAILSNGPSSNEYFFESNQVYWVTGCALLSSITLIIVTAVFFGRKNP